MKKILLPTDFSDVSKNAISYAFEMFGKDIYAGDVQFTIMHVHAVMPTSSAYLGGVVFNESEVEEQAKNSLHLIVEHWKTKYPELDIKEYFTIGKVVPSIAEYALSVPTDIIVTGSQGLGGINKMLIGSTASELAKEASCPLLIIPRGVTFKKPGKVVFATDFKNLDDLNILNSLLDVVSVYHSDFYMLHIFSDKITSFDEKEEMNNKLKAYFKDENYKHYFLHDNSPAGAIEEFVTGYNADMIVLVGQQRGYFENLFHKSVTSKMISYAKIPLLVLNAHSHITATKKEEKPFREKVKSQVEKWKTEIEEINLQMNLGKAELTENLEQKTKDTRKRIQELKVSLHKAETVTEKRWHHFKEEMSEAISHLKKAFVR